MKTFLPAKASFYYNTVAFFSKRFVLTLVFLTASFSFVCAQSITNVTVSGTPVCAGSNVTVNFDAVNGNGVSSHFTNATQYQGYISNATGVSFAPIAVPFTVTATYPTTNGASVNLQATITIPSSFPSGTAYKISVGSTSPTVNGSAGANASASFVINAPSVTISSNDPDNSICAGSSVTFTATPINTTSPTYQWQINNADVPGATGSSFTTSTLNNADQVRVVMTSSNPCATFPTVTSTVIPITVNPTVVPTVSISANPGNTICPGTSVTFSSVVFNGGAAVYQWLLNGSPISGATSATYSTNALTNGQTISLNIISNATCASPASVTSAGITFTFNPATPAQPGSITGTAVVCPAITGLTYSIAAVANATSYTWTVPTGWSITGGQNSTSLTVTSGSPAQNGNITVTATNSCGASTAQTLAVTVSPATPAQPGAITGAPAVCPSVPNLVYSIVNVANATSYTWSVPTGWSITAGQNSTSLTVTSGTAGQNGNISITATNSCGTSTVRTLAVTVNNATPSQPGSITGTAVVCPAITGLTYSIAAVANATSYTWSVPTGWSITAGQNSTLLTVTSGSPAQNGNITVTATNSCGTSSAQTLAVTVSPATPAQPAAITGTSAVCPSVANLVYSIPGVANATSYNWSVPTGWSITAGQNSTSLTVTSGTAGQNGNITVTASNSCGTSTVRTFAVTVNNATPVQPVSITGTAIVCPGLAGLTYSIAAVANATSYTWVVPTGWTITSGQNTTSITVTSGSAGQNGDITVTASNTCGTSAAQTLAVTVSPATPAQPLAITGTTPVCPSITGLTYSISAVANATSYTWTVPTGWTITAGQNSTLLTVTSGTAGQNGNISVTATNSCGTSTVRTLAVTVANGTPSQPGAITGSATQCISRTGLTYSVAAVPGATSYAWTVPAGWSITAGSTTNSITVSTGAGATSGNITVTSSNSCGTSSSQTLAVTVYTGPPSPTPPAPSIPASQLSSICPPANGLVYFIADVPNATSYTWNVPVGWTITSGQGTTSITVNAGPQSTGIKSITVTATNSCGSVTSPARTVTVGTFANVNAGPDIFVCSGTLSQPLVATFDPNSATANNDIRWLTPIPNIGTYSPNASRHNPTYNIPASIQNGGSVTLTASASAEGSCPSVTDEMVLTVLPQLSAAISVTSPVCSGTPSTITFTGTPNSIITYNTSQQVILDASGTATVVTGNLVANTTYTLNSISYATAPTCTRTYNTSAIITVNPVATVSAGPAMTICNGSTATMAGAFGGAATSATWTTSGTGTFNNNNPTAVYTPSAADVSAGSVTLTYTTNDPAGPCNAAVATMTLTINPVATVNAGVAQTICAGTTATMAGAFGGAATSATWTTSGTGTFNNNNPTAVYTPNAGDITAGTVTLTYTTNDPAGPCNAAVATMTLTINAVATVSAGPAMTICSGSTATMAGAFGGAATSATWTTSGTGTFDNNNPTAVYTPSAADVSAGSVILTYTTNDPAGPCNAAVATMTLTINPVATVNAGVAQTICAGTTATMAGAFGGAATSATWTTSGTGTFNNNNPTAVYNPSAADVSAGSVTLTYTTNDPAGPCNAAVATMTLTINPVATVSAGPAMIICSGNTATMAGAFGGAATSATWTTSGTGTFDNNNPTAVYTPSGADVSAGSVTLTYTTNDPAGPCNAAVATMTLTINPVAIVNAGVAQTICAGTTATMAGAFGGAATSATWTTSGTGTFNNNNPTAVYNPSAADVSAGSVTLTYTTNDPAGPCNAAVATMTLTINPAATVSAGSPQTVCSDLPTTLAGSFGGSATSAVWTTSGSGTFNNNTPTATYTPSINDINNGSVTLTYTTEDPAGPCGSVSASVLLTIRKAVQITTQPANTSVCASSNASMTVFAIGDQLTYQWYKGNAPGGTLIAGATNATINFTNVTIADNGSYYVVVSGASPCASVTSEVRTLNVDQSITVSTQPASQTICVGLPVTFSVAASANGAALTYQWRKNGTNIAGENATTLSISSVAASDAGTYDVVITGPSGFTCPSITSSSATLTVNLNSTLTLTSVASTTTQTICVNTPLTAITYAIGGGGTGASVVSGSLPTGLTGTYSGGIFTISGSTSQMGVFPYTVTTTGPCTNVSLSGTITVQPNATISLSSASGTDAQTICIGTPLTSITYAIGGSGNDASITAGALPAGLTGTYSSGVFTISGTPTASGIFSYTVSANGPCVNPTITGTITVNANSTITLSSLAGTTSQTLCVNTAINNITYAIAGGATGATVSGLPTGVTGTYSGGTFTISGTPTVTGNFSYSVTTTGPCINNSLGGTITVQGAATIALTSAAGTNTQTLCGSAVLTDITYAIGASGTGATITAGALPPGITGTYSGGVFTISGSPTTPGTYNYTVSTTGPCINNSLSGTIIVSANSTITLSSAGGTESQTRCVNTALTNITYIIGGGGTSASITAGTLPAGVTGNFSGGVFTISGTPTVPGNYSYTVITAGPCVNTSLSGSILVQDNSTIALSSAAGTNIQTICIDAVLTPITYSIGGAGTSASITAGALPAGLTGTYSGGVFTISGNPSVAGTFNYTVSTSGPCVNPALSGTITVQPNSTLTLTSANGTNAQAICINTALTPITYLVAAGGTSASLTAGALPTGVTGSYDNTSKVFTISGTPTVAGSYSYSITTAGPCVNVTETGTITVDPVSKAGDVAISGATAPGNVRTICPSPNSVTMTMSGTLVGNIARWDYSTNGGVSWTPVAKTTATITEDDLPQTRSYRAVVLSGVCSEAYSDTVIVDVIPPYPPTPVTASPSTVCLGQSSVLTAATGYPTSGIPAEDGNFNQGDDRGWVQDCQLHQSASGDNTSVPVWTKTNDHPFLNNIVWDSRQLKFTIVNGPGISSLESPLFSLIGQTNATLNFIQAFHLFAGASGTIDISTNGDAACNARVWTNLVTYTGTGENPVYLGNGNYNPQPFSFGQPTSFQPVNINLNAYIGLSNLRIRFRYNGGGTAWSTWALDGLSTPGTALPISYVWSGNILNSTTGIPVTATPQVIGANTYNIATTIGGCPGGNSSVTIMVSDTPSIAPPTVVPVCFSTSAQSAQLGYTGGSGDLSTYSIAWTGAASTLFTAVNDADLPGAPGAAGGTILIDVPANVPAGTYTGTMTVENSANCASSSRSFTLTVQPLPSAVPGSTEVCMSTSNQTVNLPLTSMVNAPTQFTITWSSTLATVPYTDIVGSTAIVIIPGNTPAGTYTGTMLVKNADGCVSTGTTFTIQVNAPAEITAQPNAVPFCLGENYVITAGTSGSAINHQWQVSTDGGSVWTDVSTNAEYNGATSNVLTLIIPQLDKIDYLYKVNITGTSSCPASLTSSVINVKFHNVWVGRNNNINWMDGANWADGLIADKVCDTVHILNRTFKPTLSATTAITHLKIYPGATTTVDGTGHMKIAGGIFNPDYTFDVTQGTLEIDNNLGSTQMLAGRMFTQRIVKNLTISNTTASSLSTTLDDTLNISNHIRFGEGIYGETFTTNDNLTLMSRASTGTASVGDLTNGGGTINNIVGNVLVERYIPAIRAWRFLGVPTNSPTTTYRESWQENESDNTTVKNGWGIHIPSEFSDWQARGFDLLAINFSAIKFYNPATDGYTGLDNVFLPIRNITGQMTFVRGDRTVNQFGMASKPTNLRTKGPLYAGTQTRTAPPNVFTSLGNPFASAVNFDVMSKTGGLQDLYYMWDPRLAGGFGLGAWQTFIKNGAVYDVVPGGGSYAGSNRYIESGQAFLVRAMGSQGTLTIPETSKIVEDVLVVRPGGPADLLRTSLSIVDNSGKTLMDGVMTQYDPVYSNAIDQYDAVKPNNNAESIGILSGGSRLTVERRKDIAANDTIFYKVESIRQRVYELEIKAQDLGNPGLSAWLKDNYLNTSTILDLDGSTTYRFTPDGDPASRASNRFYIVFKQLPPPAPPAPVLITSISASRNHDNSVAIDWRVENEANVQGYTIERSADGSNFTGIVTKDAGANNGGVANFAANDLSPLATDNFYRVRALLRNGQVVYSQIVKVEPLAITAGITIFPNPVQNKTMHIKFAGQLKGNYAFVLNNKLGQVMHQSSAAVTNTFTSVYIRLSTYVTAGTYQLLIISPSGEATRQQVIID